MLLSLLVYFGLLLMPRHALIGAGITPLLLTGPLIASAPGDAYDHLLSQHTVYLATLQIHLQASMDTISQLFWSLGAILTPLVTLGLLHQHAPSRPQLELSAIGALVVTLCCLLSHDLFSYIVLLEMSLAPLYVCILYSKHYSTPSQQVTNALAASQLVI